MKTRLRYNASQTVQGIPWVFEHPESHHIQWRAKWGFFQNRTSVRIENLQAELRRVNLLPETRVRLELLKKGHEAQLQSLQTLLPEFSSDLETLSVLKAIEDRVPSGQHFESYLQNVFRDWAWGDDEILRSLALIEKVSPRGAFQDQSVIHVGAGACRLSVEWHLVSGARESVALDINPVLLILAKRLLSGEKIDLYEFNHPARSLETVAVGHHLQTPLRRPPGFEFLFADGLNLPFEKKSLDAIFTPWFLDIVPMDTLALASRFNIHLRTGGTWIGFGPLGYAQAERAGSLTPAELKATLELAGFEVQSFVSEELPYLHSPYSSQKRTELVHAFRAVKTREAKEPARHAALPDFLTDPSRPATLSPAWQKLLAETRIRADLLSLIDGRHSLRDLAARIAPHTRSTSESALENLMIFFVALHEKNPL